MKTLLELEIDLKVQRAKKILGAEQLPAWSKRQILWGFFCKPPGEGGYQDIASHPTARAEVFDFMENAEERNRGLDWTSFETMGKRLRRKYRTAIPDIDEEERQDRLAPGVMAGSLQAARLGMKSGIIND